MDYDSAERLRSIVQCLADFMGLCGSGHNYHYRPLRGEMARHAEEWLADRKSARLVDVAGRRDSPLYGRQLVNSHTETPDGCGYLFSPRLLLAEPDQESLAVLDRHFRCLAA